MSFYYAESNEETGDVVKTNVIVNGISQILLVFPEFCQESCITLTEFAVIISL